MAPQQLVYAITSILQHVQLPKGDWFEHNVHHGDMLVSCRFRYCALGLLVNALVAICGTLLPYYYCTQFCCCCRLVHYCYYCTFSNILL